MIERRPLGTGPAPPLPRRSPQPRAGPASSPSWSETPIETAEAPGTTARTAAAFGRRRLGPGAEATGH